MQVERPDLSQVSPAVRAYIAALEAEVERLQPKKRVAAAEPEPSEPPTTVNVITMTAGGWAKRSPRHLYSRQRRSGMGVFDLETAEPDPPTLLTLVDEEDYFLLFTGSGRAFRLPVTTLAAAPVRANGEFLAAKLDLRPEEKIVALLPDQGGEYAALVSQRGWVQRVHNNYLGKSLLPGMTFHNIKNGGALTAACWTSGNGDLLIVTRAGKGIRFAERHVHARGCLGLRVDVDDAVVGVTAVSNSSDVFLLSHDGKGTIRQMRGFRANKAPGAGGKIVMKTDGLVTAVTVTASNDLFIVSQSGKIIRFQTNEVPEKEGVVQGVNCMGLRNDVATAVAVAAL